MSYQFEPAGFDRREELLGDRREEGEPPRQRLLTAAAAIAVMAVFAGGLWFAYYEGTRHGQGGAAAEVPLIRADARPMMVKPAEPGGLKIPDRNMLIYDPGKRLVEHLLPPPEQPMPRPLPGAAHAAAAAQAAALPQPAPRTPSGAAASAGTVAASEPAKHDAPAEKGGNVRLQLGSMRSAVAAHRAWSRLRQQNADLLGSLSANPVRVDLGDKGVYYRIETGPVGPAAANRLCGALKERKLGCVIVR